MSELVILPAPFFSDLANLALGLRREVFVIEQNVPEEDEYDELDPTAQHFVVIDRGNVVATTRIIHSGEVSRISRFAVRKSLRGKGIGARLMQHVMNQLAEEGREKVFLNSQQDKIPFYGRFGFEAYGPIFYEAEIPHRKMTNWGAAEL